MIATTAKGEQPDNTLFEYLLPHYAFKLKRRYFHRIVIRGM